MFSLTTQFGGDKPMPWRSYSASKIRNIRYRVEPQLPPDVVGIYVYLPKI